MEYFDIEPLDRSEIKVWFIHLNNLSERLSRLQEASEKVGKWSRRNETEGMHSNANLEKFANPFDHKALCDRRCAFQSLPSVFGRFSAVTGSKHFFRWFPISSKFCKDSEAELNRTEMKRAERQFANAKQTLKQIASDLPNYQAWTSWCSNAFQHRVAIARKPRVAYGEAA